MTYQQYSNLLSIANFGVSREKVVYVQDEAGETLKNIVSKLPCFYTIILRIVSQGVSFTTLAQDIGCGVSTVSQVVNEVTEAIISDMHNEAFPPITRRKLEQVARRTQARYDYARAVGFMDGRHIRIKKPAKSGSTLYNYKSFHSIILLALCDCDYHRMAFNVGSPGRFSDAAAYQLSAIKTFLDDHDEPPIREVVSVGPVQCHILVNGGFGQSHCLVRPYRENRANTPTRGYSIIN